MSSWHLLADTSIYKWCHIRSQSEHRRVSQRKKIHKGIGLRLPTISAPDVLVRVISARMFHHRNILAHTAFGAADISANGGNFQHEKFLAQEHFATAIFWHHGRSVTFRHMHVFNMGNFWHGDISAQEFSAPGLDFPEAPGRVILYPPQITVLSPHNSEVKYLARIWTSGKYWGLWNEGINGSCSVSNPDQNSDLWNCKPPWTHEPWCQISKETMCPRYVKLVQ